MVVRSPVAGVWNLFVRQGQKMLAWDQLKELYTFSGTLTIRKKGFLTNWCQLPISGIPNICVLLALIKHIQGGKLGETSSQPQQGEPAANYSPPLPAQQAEPVMNYNSPSDQLKVEAVMNYNQLPFQSQAEPVTSYNSPPPQWGYPQPYGATPSQSSQPSSMPWPAQGQWQPAYTPIISVYPVDDAALVAPKPEKNRGLALAGFILGIACVFVCAGLFSGITALAIISWLGDFPLSIVGVVLSALGCRSTSRRALAITGLVLSSIAFLLFLLFTIVVIVVAVSKHS